MPWSWIRTGLSALLIFGAAQATRADEIRVAASDLSELSLEQLNDLQVTSVSRRAERLADVAGSVFVLTSEDIRRSGDSAIGRLCRPMPRFVIGISFAWKPL